MLATVVILAEAVVVVLGLLGMCSTTCHHQLDLLDLLPVVASGGGVVGDAVEGAVAASALEVAVTVGVMLSGEVAAC